MRSDKITQGTQRAPHRALLRACGVPDEDMDKPFIGIANSYTDIVPGHIHLQELVEEVKKGIIDAGGVPFEFNTMAICDGIAMNHNGMRYSLASREIVADTVESMAEGHSLDGLVLMPTCDKVVPGMLMAAGRLDIPSIVLTGGPMEPGNFHNQSVDLITIYEAIGKVKAGTMSLEDLDELEHVACPGAGSCAGLFTANTMACITEAIGMSLPGCGTTHALDPYKKELAYQTGQRILGMIKENLKPSTIMTQDAFHNAIAIDLALGGSSNTTLHLPAITHEIENVKVDFHLFDTLSYHIPHIASISPAGIHSMKDLDQAGGVGAVLKSIQTLLKLDTLSCTGQKLREILETVKILDTEVIHSLEDPVHKEGGLSILYGNLAPNGSVVKSAAVSDDMLTHTGPAKVFNSEEEAVEAIHSDKIVEGDVIVIRYEGPKGGPGMREMLNPTSAILGMGLERVAIVTDGRFSGGTRGPCVGHISPEAAAGGPLAGIMDGDIININIPERKINCNLTNTELQERINQAKIPVKAKKGWLERYQYLASSADEGGILKIKKS